MEEKIFTKTMLVLEKSKTRKNLRVSKYIYCSTELTALKDNGPQKSKGKFLWKPILQQKNFSDQRTKEKINILLGFNEVIVEKQPQKFIMDGIYISSNS